MSSVVLITMFFFMLLAPCLISLSAWLKDAPDHDAEAAEEPVMSAAVAKSHLKPELKPQAKPELKIPPALPPPVVAPLPQTNPVRRDTLVELAEQEVRLARAAAARANAAALKAMARAARLRAEAAAEAAEQASLAAEEATAAAMAALDSYERAIAYRQGSLGQLEREPAARRAA